MHEMRDELRDVDECEQVFDLLSPHLLQVHAASPIISHHLPLPPLAASHLLLLTCPQDILWDVHGAWLMRMPFLKRRVREGQSEGSANRHGRCENSLKLNGSPTSDPSRASAVELKRLQTMQQQQLRPSAGIEYVDYRFMVELARLMRADVFVPNESLPRGRLYVINKGAVRNHAHILEPYSSFGMQDVMLHGDIVPRPDAFALNYVHTLSVRREEFILLQVRSSCHLSPHLPTLAAPSMPFASLL